MASSIQVSAATRKALARYRLEGMSYEDALKLLMRVVPADEFRRLYAEAQERAVAEVASSRAWALPAPGETAASASRRSLVRAKRDAIVALAREHGASDVRVFGSVARGDAGPESDVDVLVQFDEGASLLDHAALQLALGDLLGVPVQVVSEAALHPAIRERVLREAVAL